jgi:hypothetical protein
LTDLVYIYLGATAGLREYKEPFELFVFSKLDLRDMCPCSLNPYSPLSARSFAYICIGAKRRWKKPRGQGQYKNRDLWEELQASIVELRQHGCEVSFWLAGVGEAERSSLIPEANSAARQVAKNAPALHMERFTKLCGIMV